MTKYLSKKTVVDNIKFDSKKEAGRYSELKLLEKAGEVKDLKLQVPFCLYVNNFKICTYKADFVYINKEDKQIVEDVKGFKTPVYRLKKKLFEALFHPLKITEI